MAENLVNDLTSAVRSFDVQLRRQMDEFALNENAVEKSPEIPPSPVVAPATNDKRKDKVPVSVSILFAKINGIDTIKDRFVADVQVQIKWREPLFDNKRLQSSNIKWDQYWTPKLYVENNIGELKTKVNFGLKYDASGKATVVESRQISGTYFEFMELNKFPYDSQDLTVTLVSERTKEEVELSEDQDAKCAIKPTAFGSVQEWKQLPIINSWNKTTKKTVDGVKTKHPGFSCGLKTSRRPEYYMYNIIMLLAMMGSFSMATFTVAITNPQSRLQLTFFLMLTTITFKFTVNKSLPKIPYLTYMDKYILGIMFMIFGVCIWHAVIGGIIHPYFANTTVATSPATTTAKPVAVTSSSGIYSNVTWPAITTTATITTTPASKPYDMYEYRKSLLSYAVANETQLADRVALGMVASTFLTIHLAFFIAGALSYRNLEELTILGDDDEEKDD